MDPINHTIKLTARVEVLDPFEIWIDHIETRFFETNVLNDITSRDFALDIFFDGFVTPKVSNKILINSNTEEINFVLYPVRGDGAIIPNTNIIDDWQGSKSFTNEGFVFQVNLEKYYGGTYTTDTWCGGNPSSMNFKLFGSYTTKSYTKEDLGW